ncbi:PREDICTED: uncharacterized protein LOC109191082 [Ipomoea nil]|uniref:uncharacterized protein LOC109191082 n=1 Tax=Ipomoea nil TaxID=35883 RepID=UPI000901EA5F|nr:PREDICTED: uncharacterized protein LOC109191082 [Ipomoea nil]
MYSVKDAYRQIVGDFVHNPATFDKWITLWKLKVPAKWKTFLWRALCDILPTTNNLIIRRVEVDPTCPMCDISHEHVMHTHTTCDYSKIVWNISGLPVTNIVATTFPEWLMGAMINLTEEQLAMMVGVLYHLWNARNDAVWRRALPRPPATWRRAAAAKAAYNEAHCPGGSRTPLLAAPLPQGRPRCFFDGGYRPHSGDATYGIVLVHPDGSFKAETNGKLPGCFY